MLKALNEINLNEDFAMLVNEINEIEMNINLIVKVLIKKILTKTIKIINLNFYITCSIFLIRL